MHVLIVLHLLPASLLSQLERIQTIRQHTRRACPNWFLTKGINSDWKTNLSIWEMAVTVTCMPDLLAPPMNWRPFEVDMHAWSLSMHNAFQASPSQRFLTSSYYRQRGFSPFYTILRLDHEKKWRFSTLFRLFGWETNFTLFCFLHFMNQLNAHTWQV